METQAQIAEAITKIDTILRSGIESVSTDGTSTKVNFEQLRKERDDLKRQLATNRMKRPVSSRIYLGGF